jgi:hypothetical protein
MTHFYKKKRIIIIINKNKYIYIYIYIKKLRVTKQPNWVMAGVSATPK